MRSPRPTFGKRSFGAGHALGFRRALCIDERQFDVVQGRGTGQQVKGLEDEADLPVADMGELAV